MTDLNIVDLKHGSYTKNTPVGDLQAHGVEHLADISRISTCFPFVSVEVVWYSCIPLFLSFSSSASSFSLPHPPPPPLLLPLLRFLSSAVLLIVPSGEDGQLMSSLACLPLFLWLSANRVQLTAPIGDDDHQLMSVAPLVLLLSTHRVRLTVT